MTVTEAAIGYYYDEGVEESVLLNAPVPAHLSIELGHFYPDDLSKGPEHFMGYFRRIARYARVAAENYADRNGLDAPRISTTMMVDDYRKLQNVTPQRVIGELLLPAAQAAGLEVDYLAREAACAAYTPAGSSQQISPANILLGRIIDIPPIGSPIGSEQPSSRTGWVCNGSRPVASSSKADASWTPAQEYGADLHTTFMDVEIFSERKRDGRIWACPMLATVWQAARLGDLHNQAKPAMAVQAAPRDEGGSLNFGESWNELPAIMQVNPNAAGFEAYNAYSILPARYLSVESAVRTILEQVGPIEESNLIHDIAAKEGVSLPSLHERLEYAFSNDF
jgi:hypothetical protein